MAKSAAKKPTTTKEPETKPAMPPSTTTAAAAEKPLPKKATAKKAAAKVIEESPPAPVLPVAVPPPPSKLHHRHLRAPIEIRVEITARSQSFTTTSRNIALGGISFESQQQFRVGDLVNVLLYIPVRKELELLKCASEIVWVEDLKGSWMCGAAFRKFAPGDERRLREWLLESVRAQKAGLALSSMPEIDDGPD